MDNKTLRTYHSQIKCVIVTKRDGVDKYISKEYFRKHAFQYTIKLNKAMVFEDVYKANRFMEENGIEDKAYGIEVKWRII